MEDGINEFAENNNLDMIIAIPKNISYWKAVQKSSTKQLVFQSHVPVMCVHWAKRSKRKGGKRVFLQYIVLQSEKHPQHQLCSLLSFS